MRLLLALAAVAALLIGGCGGSDSSNATSTTGSGSSGIPPKSSPAESQKIESTPFGKRVTIVCFNGARALGSLPRFPFPTFDLIHPDAARLPAVGRYFEQGSLPAYQKLIARLKAVKPPAAEQQRYDDFVTQVEALAANLKRQIAAAKSSDAKGFVAAVKAVDNRKLANAESALGVRACFGIS
jgi:hypothetical protein